uniref:Legume lectin domain-containing protein n=1 Tax=Oryza rufipogon TaxID=4529 RepID=A0A0E0Q7K1_ORYRU
MIEFDGATNALALTLRFDDNATLAPAHIISTRADVKRLLTQEVAFGFSATTGTWIERHRILSWSFNSTTVAVEDRSASRACLLLTIVTFNLTLVWEGNKDGEAEKGRNTPVMATLQQWQRNKEIFLWRWWDSGGHRV